MKILVVAMLAVNAWGMKKESAEQQINNLNTRIFTMIDVIKKTLEERDDEKLKELSKRLDEVLKLNNSRKPNENIKSSAFPTKKNQIIFHQFKKNLLRNL
jgi:hypothetical protein